MYREKFAKRNEFTCRYEYRPELSPETQQLYHYALYYDLHNMWAGKNNDEVWQNAAVYYRIAAANNDYKANVRLQYLLSTGRVGTGSNRDVNEVHELNKKLAETLLATAYYNIAGYFLGIVFEDNKEYIDALKAYHLGVKGGYYMSSYILSKEFSSSNNLFLQTTPQLRSLK